jgi:hypothetical protein
MKQIIFSIAISFSAQLTVAQTGAGKQLASSETEALTITKLSLSESLPTAIVDGRDSVTIRMFRNTEGVVVKALRYYTAVDFLPVHIHSRLSKKFPDYVPTAIIEEHDGVGVGYVINLSKGNRWLQVHSTSNGRINIRHRYYNSLLNVENDDLSSTLQ